MKSVYMYKLEKQPFVKFGYSQNVAVRASDYRTSSPHTGSMVWSYPVESHRALEKVVRKIWGQYHVRGEWYSLPDDEIDRMKRRIVMMLHDMIESPDGMSFFYIGDVVA